MTRRTKRRGVLTGWWNCLPLIAVPFSTLFVEGWLQTGIVTGNYKINELTTLIREAEDGAEAIRDDMHRLKRIERVTQAGPRMGLVLPEPWQLEVIRPDADPALGGVRMARLARELRFEVQPLPRETATPKRDGARSGGETRPLVLKPLDAVSGTD